MADDLDQQIRDAAAGPAEVTIDGQTVRQQPLADQIAADRYLASKDAAKSKRLGIRLIKLSPPGAE
jgi:hypothetical protein